MSPALERTFVESLTLEKSAMQLFIGRLLLFVSSVLVVSQFVNDPRDLPDFGPSLVLTGIGAVLVLTSKPKHDRNQH